MIGLMSRHPELITEEILPSLVKLVGRDGSRDTSGYNILHLSCLNPNSDTLSTIRFLAQLEADLNAREDLDENGFGALHILALGDNVEIRDATARLLLEIGEPTLTWPPVKE